MRQTESKGDGQGGTGTGTGTDTSNSKGASEGDGVGVGKHIAKDSSKDIAKDSAKNIDTNIDKYAGAPSGIHSSTGMDIDTSADWAQLTLACLPEGVITNDSHGLVTFINAAACAMTGQSVHEAIGQPLDSVLDICGSLVTQRDGSTLQIDCTTTPLLAPAAAGPAASERALRAVIGAVHVLRAVAHLASPISVLETRLSAVVEQLPVGVGLFDVDGRLQLSNTLLARYMGRTFPPRDQTGMPRWRAWRADGSSLPPNDWPVVRALRGDVVQTGVEFLATRDDGHNTWVRVMSAPFRDAEGDIAGALAVLEDIDEFKRAQRALQATTAQLQLVTQHLPVRIAHIDAALRYRFVNQPYAARLGLQSHSLVGQRVVDIIGAAAYALIERYLASALRGLPQDFDIDATYPSGDTQFVRCALVPERDAAGAVVGLVESVVDISDRKIMEDAMRASEERLRTIMESALDYAIFTTDVHCIVMSWSDGAERLLGYTAAEMLGCDARIIFTPEHRASGGPEASKTSALADGRFEIDGWRVRKDGTRFWASGMLMPLRDQYRPQHPMPPAHRAGKTPDASADHDDPRAGFLTVLRDVSDARHDKLLLERQATALQDSARHKDEFLAMVAHELRNPMVPLRNAVQLMRKAGGDPVDRDKWCAMMDRQIKQMTALIDDLLDVSRISRGEITLRTTPLLLVPLLRDAVQSSRLYVEAAGHVLTFAAPLQATQTAGVAHTDTAADASANAPANAPTGDADLVVAADATRLLQVFANLLTNAAKFTPRGGHIRLALQRDGAHAVVTVEDNGIGIEADMLPKVFELYAQVESAKTTSQGGLGLGLAIVRRLVELHGGSVAASSPGAGRGSRFTVRLPLCAVPPELWTPPAPPVPPDTLR